MGSLISAAISEVGDALCSAATAAGVNVLILAFFEPDGDVVDDEETRNGPVANFGDGDVGGGDAEIGDADAGDVDGICVEEDMGVDVDLGICIDGGVTVSSFDNPAGWYTNMIGNGRGKNRRSNYIQNRY